jgi:hypothetical protein
MPSAELENLVRIGRLKREPPSEREQQGLLESADARLAEYEGHLEPDERLFKDLVAAARTLRDAIDGLPADEIGS